MWKHRRLKPALEDVRVPRGSESSSPAGRPATRSPMEAKAWDRRYVSELTDPSMGRGIELFNLAYTSLACSDHHFFDNTTKSGKSRTCTNRLDDIQ